MKSLQESLFDNDLVKKGVKIDFETLLDMLFYFGRSKAKLFNKACVIYHEGRQSIYIKRFLGENDKVCFELEFSITNLWPDKQAAFNAPALKSYDRWQGDTGKNSWKSSRSDGFATGRNINKKLGIENKSTTVTIEATDETVGKVFELYEGMVKEFCSKEFEKKLQEYVDRFEEKRAIPGLMLDFAMNQLITKA